MKNRYLLIGLLILMSYSVACKDDRSKLHDKMVQTESEFWYNRSTSHVLLNRMIGKETQVVWSTTFHTAAPVPVGAVGPREYTSKLQGIIQNDSLGRVIRSAVEKKINVILVVGDGMGNMHMALSVYKRYGDRDSSRTMFEKIMGEGSCGYLYTGTARGLVTGSAASGTAIACGKKTLMNMVGVDSTGRPLHSSLDLAVESNYKTALVTDAGITDATPAAFYAHSIDRDEGEKIVNQLAEKKGIDVILGGGASLFIPKGKDLSEIVPGGFECKSGRTDSINLIADFKATDYQFCTSLLQLNNIKDGKVLGLFSGGGLPASINRDHKSVSIPNVSQMCNKALELVSSYNAPYMAVIECARIDWEAHDNDIGAVYQAVEELNDVLEIAYQKYKESPENTLLIFTADHETGGLEVAYRKMDKKDEQTKKMYNGEIWKNITNPLTYREFAKNLERQKKTVSKVFSESKNQDELKKNLKVDLGIIISDIEAEQLFYSMTDYKKYKD